MINNQILEGKINRKKRFFLFVSFKDLEMMIQIENIQREGQKNKSFFLMNNNTIFVYLLYSFFLNVRVLFFFFLFLSKNIRGIFSMKNLFI